MKKYLLVAMMAACGGSSGSGLDRNLLVVDLTDSEVTQECQYLFDNFPSRTDDCGGGDTSTVGEDSVGDCEDSIDDTIDGAPDCDVTVGESEDCIEDLYDTVCPSSLPASCAPLFSQDCVASSSRKLVEQKLQRSILSR